MKALVDANVILVDIVNRLCGHSYEYGTADINILYFICTISRINATYG